MSNGCICWVIALPSEAKTLIEEFKMFPIQGDTLFPVYKNKNEEMYVLEFYCQECVSFYRIKDVCSLNGPMFGERTSL